MTAHPPGRMTLIQFVRYREQLMKEVQAGLTPPRQAYNDLAHRALEAIAAAPPRFDKGNLVHIAVLTLKFRQWAKYDAAPKWKRAPKVTPSGVEDQS